jgi:hypothetical protein
MLEEIRALSEEPDVPRAKGGSLDLWASSQALS